MFGPFICLKASLCLVAQQNTGWRHLFSSCECYDTDWLKFASIDRNKFHCECCYLKSLLNGNRLHVAFKSILLYPSRGRTLTVHKAQKLLGSTIDQAHQSHPPRHETCHTSPLGRCGTPGNLAKKKMKVRKMVRKSHANFLKKWSKFSG